MTPVAAPPPPMPAAPTDGRPRVLTVRRAATFSVCAHLLVVLGAVAFTRVSKPAPRPPAYNVELVAAPAGPRALGSVSAAPTTRTPPQPSTPAPERVATPTPTPTPAAPRRPTAAAPTPSRAPATPAPRTPPRSGGEVAVPGRTPAGGGPTGGRGRDVASVKVQGIAFPFPGYLENITRQIALNFKPRAGGALRAEVAFLIHRDGSVSDLRLTSRSGAYAFDLECMGAVEAVGQRKSFGPLPAGFRDDVLPVVFSFDPTVLR
jgi:periplasmic protein TonB